MKRAECAAWRGMRGRVRGVGLTLPQEFPLIHGLRTRQRKERLSQLLALPLSTIVKFRTDFPITLNVLACRAGKSTACFRETIVKNNISFNYHCSKKVDGNFEISPLWKNIEWLFKAFGVPKVLSQLSHPNSSSDGVLGVVECAEAEAPSVFTSSIPLLPF